jgi:hypothetical protein
MISKIVSLLIVGSFFDTNINQSSCLENGPSSQLDLYTPLNDDQIFYASYKPSQQIKH